MRFLREVSAISALTLALLAVGTAAAKDKRPQAPPKSGQDAIQVVGHLQVTGGPVTRFLATEHHSSHYLYAEHSGGQDLTLIDVTRAAQPTVVAEVSYPVGEPGSLYAVAGTAAVVTEAAATAPAAPVPQIIRIMDFSDPEHPRVSREIAGVTAMSRDDQRGLIFVANAEGIWILHENIALDPEVEKEYARHVLYDH